MTPLVSFLTPAYNAATYLGATIRSVLEQSYTNIELIIVNDGSKDETSKVAHSYADPRVKVIDQENQGQSASENVAFQASQGDYVVHLDADDLISPNKVEVQLKRLREATPDCIAFHPWGRFYHSINDAKAVPEPFWRDIKPLDFHIEMWTRHSMIQGGCYLIPRELMELAGPWNASLSLINDFDFFPRVLTHATELLFCPEPMLHYRSGLPNALSGTKSSAAWDSAFRAMQNGTSLLLAKEDSPRSRKACSRCFEEFVYGAYPAVPELRTKAWAKVNELGGPYFQPQMGPKMRLFSSVFGWKFASRLRSLTKGRR